jgi:hypothetical protein
MDDVNSEHIIHVTIREKIATADKTLYVCGNSDFVVHFDCDAEWAAFDTKTARFIADDNSYIDVVFQGTVCEVPVLSNTHRVRVGVFAGSLVTTTPAYITATKSILCSDGVPADPPEDVYNQIMEKINTVGKEEFEKLHEDISGVANELAQQAAVLTEQDVALDQRTQALEKRFADMDYGEGIVIASFGHGVGTKEKGSSIERLTLTWSYKNGKKPTTQTLNGAELPVTDRSKAETGLNITMDRSTWPTWKLTATDERNKVVTASTPGFTFLNGVYYGVLEDGATIDSAAILKLTRSLQSSKSVDFTANAGASQRIAYALPSSGYGTPVFSVGGFEGGFYKAETFQFTNGSKYTESYDVWLSDELDLGSTSVKVR